MARLSLPVRLASLLLAALAAVILAVGAQQIQPINQAPAILPPGYDQPPSPVPGHQLDSNGAVNQEKGEETVDRIETIDALPTQLILSTSKVGPPETLKVSIRVVDVEAGTELPPTNLTGFLLALTRGRYTISFLQPAHWYGLVYRSERQPGGDPAMRAGGEERFVNEERHLVRTRKEDGADGVGQSLSPLVSIVTRRHERDGKSLENLVLTMRWEQPPEMRPNLETVANITLHCKERARYKQLRLHGRDAEKSVEVKLDNHFEVASAQSEEPRGNQPLLGHHHGHHGHHHHHRRPPLSATITPKNCQKICWASEIVAETPAAGSSPLLSFRRPAASACEELGPVNATTHLREYVGYESRPTSLVLHTNYTDPEHGDKEPDAYVQLTALELHEQQHEEEEGGPGTNSSSLPPHFKLYNPQESPNGSFELGGLATDRLYAVQYTYGRESPFAYSESRRFIVDTSAAGGAGISPVRVVFPSAKEGRSGLDERMGENATMNVTTAMLEEPTETTPMTEPPAMVESMEEPRMALQLDPAFNNYEVGVDLEPFCDPATDQGDHFWLSKEHPVKELDHLDIRDAVCSQAPQHSICARAADNSSSSANNMTTDVEEEEDERGSTTGPPPANDTNATSSPDWKECPLGAQLCYVASVLVKERVYSMQRKCVDVAKAYPMVEVVPTPVKLAGQERAAGTRIASTGPKLVVMALVGVVFCALLWII